MSEASTAAVMPDAAHMTANGSSTKVVHEKIVLGYQKKITNLLQASTHIYPRPAGREGVSTDLACPAPAHATEPLHVLKTVPQTVRRHNQAATTVGDPHLQVLYTQQPRLGLSKAYQSPLWRVMLRWHIAFRLSYHPT